MHTIIPQDPFTDLFTSLDWSHAGQWPCRWVGCPGAQVPFVAAFRLVFPVERPETVCIHVSADERYELFLDGARIGRGPQRGSPSRWHFETYDLPLEAGGHSLVVRVWALGELAPIAQFSLRPGFLLCPQEEAWLDRLATGRAPWQAKVLPGYAFTPPLGSVYVGHQLDVDGRLYPYGFETGQGTGWLDVEPLEPAFSGLFWNQFEQYQHRLFPASLPAMLDRPWDRCLVRHVSAPALSETHSLPILASEHLQAEAAQWQALLAGSAPLTLPPNTRRRVIVDLEDYLCAYPEVTVRGGDGARLRLNWQESLFADTTTWDKGNRDEVEGKYFTSMWWNQDGIGDSYRLGGGGEISVDVFAALVADENANEPRSLDTLWWKCGRYVEVLVETSNTALTIEKLVFNETRYPLENESTFSASDARLEAVTPIAVRVAQMCAHETYMDCPFFEQLQYIGDTRLQCLVTYMLTRDARLPRQALQAFDDSRGPDGLTQSRYPTRLRQMIPPFSLWNVGMLHDYWMWRGDPAFVRRMLPGMRAVLDAFTLQRGEHGLVVSPQGWNFTDWVLNWPGGEPAGARSGGVSSLVNWQYVYSLGRMAEMEFALGEVELAQRWRRLARDTSTALVHETWDAGRGLLADDRTHTIYSEHAQCLALLSGFLPEGLRSELAGSFDTPGLTRPTVYFMHYFFETCQQTGRMELFFERLAHWFEMDQMGFCTTYENADPHTNRSDCHAWGAHPLYHYYASVLGIRPAAPGFASVNIRPQLGSLDWARGALVHPGGGTVEVEFNRQADGLHGLVSLPSSLEGELQVNGGVVLLMPGETRF